MKTPRYSNLLKFVVSLLCIFGGATFIFSDEGAIHVFTGSGGVKQRVGDFFLDYGNAGIISFDENVTGVDTVGNVFTPANLYGTSFSGYFWSESVGWMTFTGDTTMTPRETGSGVRETWDVNGFVWSPYAGYLSLSGVEYFPDTASLSGWLWSSTLGWTALTNVVADNIGLGFIGRVKIIGNLGGNNIYTTLYTPGEGMNYANVTNALNQIRKTISLNVRNVGSTYINTFDSPTWNPVSGFLYFENNENIQKYLEFSSVKGDPDRFLNSSTVRSLVLVGGDLYIDSNVDIDKTLPGHAIIVMKNSYGVGGNIYIKGNVTKIHSSLIAEGSIYSGLRTGSDWDYYNADKIRTTTLPNYQLYVFGSIISRNTIGGAGILGGSKCPFTENTCTYDQALRYDFNYFRDFQTGAIASPPQDDVAAHRGYSDSTYDDKSLVIEYDPRIVSDPPPNLIQN